MPPSKPKQPMKYDEDCSIIKNPVTSDEFRKEIDLLKEEIANLKKEIESLKSKNNNDFIIDTVVEKENQQILKYIKSIISSKDFRDSGRFKISEFTYHSQIKNYKNLIMYLSRRNLQIKYDFESIEYYITLIDETQSIREETITCALEQSSSEANPFNNQPGQTF